MDNVQVDVQVNMPIHKLEISVVIHVITIMILNNKEINVFQNVHKIITIFTNILQDMNVFKHVLMNMHNQKMIVMFVVLNVIIILMYLHK